MFIMGKLWARPVIDEICKGHIPKKMSVKILPTLLYMQARGWRAEKIFVCGLNYNLKIQRSAG